MGKMTLDEAIAHALEIAGEQGCTECGENHVQLARWLEELRALRNEKQQWISVKDRLPEKQRASYLCYTDVGYCCEVRWTNNVYGLGESDDWAWNHFDVAQYSHVTHWMPIPTPPKEEANV